MSYRVQPEVNKESKRHHKVKDTGEEPVKFSWNSDEIPMQFQWGAAASQHHRQMSEIIVVSLFCLASTASIVGNHGLLTFLRVFALLSSGFACPWTSYVNFDVMSSKQAPSAPQPAQSSFIKTLCFIPGRYYCRVPCWGNLEAAHEGSRLLVPQKSDSRGHIVYCDTWSFFGGQW